MKISIWKKADIHLLTKELQNQWFEVYNEGLEEDYGYDLQTMSEEQLEHLSQDIRRTYLEYLHGLAHDVRFQFYVLIQVDERIVSAARVVWKKGYYYLEGLQTHASERRKGYGYQCIKTLLQQARHEGFEEIYSRVKNHNIKSLKLHRKIGFEVKYVDTENTIFHYQLKSN